MIHEPAEYSWKHDRRRSVDAYRELALQVWQQEALHWPEMAALPDYTLGFRDGFVDYVYAGGTGEPPPVPPRHFWNVALRAPDGRQRVAQWFAGYRHGARAARDGGFRQLGTVDSSLFGITASPPGSHFRDETDPIPIEAEEFWQHADFDPHTEVLPEPQAAPVLPPEIPVDLPEADGGDAPSGPFTKASGGYAGDSTANSMAGPPRRTDAIIAATQLVPTTAFESEALDDERTDTNAAQADTTGAPTSRFAASRDGISGTRPTRVDSASAIAHAAVMEPLTRSERVVLAASDQADPHPIDASPPSTLIVVEMPNGANLNGESRSRTSAAIAQASFNAEAPLSEESSNVVRLNATPDGTPGRLSGPKPPASTSTLRIRERISVVDMRAQSRSPVRTRRPSFIR